MKWKFAMFLLAHPNRAALAVLELMRPGPWQTRLFHARYHLRRIPKEET